MINWQKNYQDQVELSRKAFAIIKDQIAELNRCYERIAQLESAQPSVQTDGATYESDGLLFCKTCGSSVGVVEDEPPSQYTSR